MGLHSDLTGERIWHVALAALVGAIGLTASAFLGFSPVLALIALTVSAVGIYSGLPAFWTLPTVILSRTAAAGGIALINSLGNLGGYLRPSLVGYLKDRTKSYAAGLMILGLFIAVSGILTLYVGYQQKRAVNYSETER